MSKKLSTKDRAMSAALSIEKPALPPLHHEGSERKSGGNSLSASLMGMAVNSDLKTENENLKKRTSELESLSSNLQSENSVLNAANSELQAAPKVMLLNPQQIRDSKWANRHKDSFKSAEFNKLRDEIQSAGGNVQPIKVRSLSPSDGEFKYEIVFGHRRHQACSELGISVSAIVEELDAKHLFIEMDRENRQRADLRPYEQGVMYKRALDEGLFPSLRKLSEEIDEDPGNVSRAVQLARLPEGVLDAFVSRLDVQYRWASDLTSKISTDADVVLSRAKSIIAERASGAKISSAEAFNRLVGIAAKASLKKPRVVKVGAHSLTIFEADKSVSFEVTRVPKDKLSKIEKYIAGVLAE